MLNELDRKSYQRNKNLAAPLICEIHTHSTVSDGVFSPVALAEFLKSCGVQLWALTDHDTAEGCAEAAVAAAELGIQFIPGIEISAQQDGQSIHVLGYGFDPQHPEIIAYGERMGRARAQRMESMRLLICDLGFPITADEVASFSERGVLGRPHIARAMLMHGYVETVQQAFDLYLADGKPAYVDMDWIGVDQAIELLQAAGGLVVLAHPSRYELRDHLERWVSAGLSGLEVRHPSHYLVDEARLGALCDRYGLLKTASSDFHGSEAPVGELKEFCGRVNFPPVWQDEFLDAIRTLS